MKIAAATLVIAFGILSVAAAQEGGGFTIPTAYSVDRYETGWNTNPFTLKTAAPAVEKISAFKDLVLGNMYQNGNESNVTLINTKTRERIRLVSTRTDPSGMRIKSANILSRRADSYAEIERDGETAVLRYDDKILAQLNAQGQIAQHPGPDAGNPAMADMAANGIPVALQGMPQQPPRGRLPNGAPPPAPMTNLPDGSVINAPPNSGIMPVPNRNNPPPVRRRLLTAPQPQGQRPPGMQPPTGMPPPITPP